MIELQKTLFGDGMEVHVSECVLVIDAAQLNRRQDGGPIPKAR